jgi:hypothetical protein
MATGGGNSVKSYGGDARIFVATGPAGSDPVVVYVGDTLYETVRVWTFHNGVAVMTDLFGEAGAGTVLESLGGHSRSPLGQPAFQAPDDLRVARRFPISLMRQPVPS